MAAKRPEGIYPYTSTEAWSERLAEAVENTCHQEGLVPAPRAAIVEGLGSALGDTEIKKLVTSLRGQKVLAPHAYRVVKAGDDRVLLLTCDVHGAAVVPWDLNDRTVSFWTPPSPEAMDRVKALVDAEYALEEAQKAVRLAMKERDAHRRAVGDDTYAAAALAAAEDKLSTASALEGDAQRSRDALLASLGSRRPRPVVRSVEESGEPKAALVLAAQPYEVAVHMQRYAVENLRRAGRTRGYDLVESLVAAGQLSRGMCVLQQWQVEGRNGENSRLWRMVAVTANNRALARLDIFGLQVEHLVTGMPQSRYPLPRESSDSSLLLLNQREVLNRVSWHLNEARAKEDTDQEHPAHRAAKVTTVPTEIVVGCSNPDALEHLLRALNVNDHLRGIQPYDEDARLIALFATLVDAYARDGLLAMALADAFPSARGADRLDLDGVRSALTGNGPFDPLTPLLPVDEEATSAALRDLALRSITALVFPDVPPAPAGSGRRQVRDTGRYWPIVRASLQEPAWSQVGGKTGEARTRLWSAAVAQLYMQRGNILSAQGLFTVADTKEGARQDPRSLKDLFLGAQAGDATAWAALVRRIVPNLIHAPEPMITPGQGSEVSAQRKGVRRTPSNAVAALTVAYTRESLSVTRELLLAFAVAALGQPDATQAPLAADGSMPVCYGEQTWSSKSPIVPGMVLAPGTDGQPTAFVADKAWFDELFPSDWDRSASAGGIQAGTNTSDSEAGSADESTADTARVVGGVSQDPRARLSALRNELSARIELVEGAYERAVGAADTLLSDFETAQRLRKELGEEPLPADRRIEMMERLTKARGAAEASVSALAQVEGLILQL
ncbi:hypothetical protein ACFYZ4_29545 [Streptomyces sp. NPDC001513]|uniref:hypothetical protein n=1 Tax=Streptomyces sp. NPDC001513 TaxID=3364580 RepID=UPI0036B0216B